MVEGICVFGVVFPFLKRRQLHFNCSDSEWSFSNKRMSVTRITTAQMAQIEKEMGSNY